MSLPTFFTAKGRGLICSRSGWGPDDTLFYLVAGSTLESHEDRNQGHFGLYRGGWLAAQAKLLTQSGLAQSLWESNCLQFGAAPQAWTQNGVTLVAEDAPAYTWASADLTAAYAPQVASYVRDYLLLKPNFLLLRDTFSGNSQPATIWLQSLAPPQIVNARFQAGRLFGQFLAGPMPFTAPYRQTTTQPTPSYRLQAAATSPFVTALEAGSAGQTATTLGISQHTPGLDGITCGTEFVGFCSGPGPFQFSAPAFARHFLAGLKPSTPYLVTGLPGVQASSPGGILSFFASAGPVTVSEQVIPPPPPSLTITGVSPNPTTSGQLVTVTGTGLAMVAQVRWAGGVMPFTLVNPTTLTFIAPAVTVVTAGIVSAISTGAVAQGPSLIVQPPVSPGSTYSIHINPDGTATITKVG